MATSRHQPETIIQILLDRISGVPQAETAKAVGYTRTQALSRVVKKFKLDEVEAQIRLALRLESHEVPSEILDINKEYEDMLIKTTEVLKSSIDALEFDSISEDGKRPSLAEKMQAINTMVVAMEKARSARISIASLRAEKEDKNTEDDDASAFEDLVDD